MKVKGLNKAYDVEIRKIISPGKEVIQITCGNLFSVHSIGMISVIISKEDWEKLKTI